MSLSVIKFAEKRLKEENDLQELGYKDNNHLINYWAAYLDGAKAQKKEDLKEDIVGQVFKLSLSIGNAVASYTEKMNALDRQFNEELAKLNDNEES